MKITIELTKRQLRTIQFVILALMFVLLTAESCESTSDAAPTNTTLGPDQNIVNDYYPRLRDSVPYPLEQMRTSSERANIRERLLRFNNLHKTGYVYLLYPTGQVAGYYTIRGKVSNTDSQMTAADQVEKRCDKEVAGCDFVVRTSPGDDGSFGPNEEGIYFFTAEDVIIESNLYYMYSDAPLKLNDQHFIVFQQDVPQPSSVGESFSVREERAAEAESGESPTPTVATTPDQ